MNPMSEQWSTLAWTQLWQVTVLIAAVALLIRMFCRQRPHMAYVLWILVIVKCVTPPLWSSPTGVFSWLQAWQVESPASRSDQTQPVVAFEMSGNPRADGLPEKPAAETVRPPLEAVESPVVTPSKTHFSTAVMGSVWLMSVSVWLAGVVILAIVIVARWFGLYVRLQRTAQAANPEVAAAVAKLSELLGIRRPARVLITTEAVGPAVFGFVRPAVVLPRSLLENVTPESIEPILAHELIHIRRWDALAGLLQAVAQTIWWFHPLVWWANRQASRERERCCDQEVVSGMGCPPASYARSLLDVLELKRRLRSVFAVPGIRPLEVTSRRLEDIMRHSNRFHHKTPRWCWGVVVAGAALVLPGAGIVRQATSASANARENQPQRNSQESAPAARRDGIAFRNNRPDKGDVPKKKEATPASNDQPAEAEREAVAALRGLGAEFRSSMSYVKLNGPHVTDADLVHFKHLKSLERIDLSRTGVSGAGLVHLKGLPKLQSLTLNDTRMTDKGLTHVAQLRNLRHVELSATGISDIGLAHLKDMKSLESVSFKRTNITGAGLVHLKNLPKLQSLYLGHSQVTDESLKHVAQLPHLRRLHLRYTGISESGLAHLKDMVELQFLSLNDTQLTDAGLAHLKKLVNLKQLWLHQRDTGTGRQIIRITDAGLVNLKGMKKLKTLNLAYTGIGDAGLAHLKGLSALDELFLSGTRVGDAGLQQLGGLKKLAFLEISWTRITDAGLIHLKALPIEILGVGETALTDRGAETLGEFTKLVRLHIGHTQVTEAGFKLLKQKLPQTKIIH